MFGCLEADWEVQVDLGGELMVPQETVCTRLRPDIGLCGWHFEGSVVGGELQELQGLTLGYQRSQFSLLEVLHH